MLRGAGTSVKKTRAGGKHPPRCRFTPSEPGTEIRHL